MSKIQGRVDNDLERFVTESARSYKECQIKNNARRNSLQKKTVGIEQERRLANAEMGREERVLREQLKQMKIDKLKHSIVQNMRATKGKTKHPIKEDVVLHIPTEPYPVTLRNKTPSPVDENYSCIDTDGQRYLTKAGRRTSKEAEDLLINTQTGRFLQVPNEAEEFPRKRVWSLSLPVKPSIRKSLGFSSPSASPRTSPGLRRKRTTSDSRSRKTSESHSPYHSRESIENIDELHWAGDPEAIHSVRRPRRTVEEQELNAELHKLSHQNK